jgi:CAAX prenyl protease-like protein
MNRNAVPFVAPFLLFMTFLIVESWFPDQHYALYPLKTLAVGGLVAWYWRSLPDLKPGAPFISVLIGVAGVVVWIGLNPLLVHGATTEVGRNPFALYSVGLAWTLFAFRLIGSSLVVPLMEELFWRGFLMRWLIREEFTEVPLGAYQPFSFFATTALFASEHGSEWPLGAIVGLLYGAWFVRTKKLGDVMVAHGTTNLLLALYCLFSGDWHFLSTVVPLTK